MKINLSLSSFLAGSAMICAAPAVFAGDLDSLRPGDLDQLKTGKQVTRTVDRGGDWPETTVFQYIDATPESAAAIFHDYDAQSSYCPDLTRSEVVGTNNKARVRVDYTMVVKRIFHEDYSVWDTLSKPSEHSYKISWTLVSPAKHTDSSVGSATFLPYGSGTVLKYNSYIVPNVMLASHYASESVTKVQDAVSAITKKVNTQGKPTQEQKKMFDDALADATGHRSLEDEI